jgi:hypothetical protein
VGYAVASRNAAIGAVAALGNWCSLHTGDPGATGANAVSGQTPAQTTWGSPAGGSVTGSVAEIGHPGGGADVTHFGVWTSAAMTTFVAGGILDNPEGFTGPGAYRLTPTLAT